jgi:hypothetical protein
MLDVLEELKQRYRRFADDECGDYGALYFQLSHAVVLVVPTEEGFQLKEGGA